MKFIPLFLSLIVLPMIMFNTGMVSLTGQNHPASVVQTSSAPSELNENPPLTAAAAVIEPTTGPNLPAPAPQAKTHSYTDNPAYLATPATPLEQSVAADSTLNNFVALLKNGQAGQVTGVYVPGILALRVTQQPTNSPAYVNTTLGFATQFKLAAQNGAIGLLAHNYLSGALFSTLSVGQAVDIIYGDGSIRRYGISTLRHFQAINPTSPTSDFVDMDNNSGARISNSDLFYQIYASNRVVFQTCINAHGNESWGRLFVIATPVP